MVNIKSDVSVPRILVKRPVQQSNVQPSAIVVLPERFGRRRLNATGINSLPERIVPLFEVLKTKELAARQDEREQDLMVLWRTGAFPNLVFVPVDECAPRLIYSLRQM
jgi:hypothetical protein